MRKSCAGNTAAATIASRDAWTGSLLHAPSKTCRMAIAPSSYYTKSKDTSTRKSRSCSIAPWGIRSRSYTRPNSAFGNCWVRHVIAKQEWPNGQHVRILRKTEPRGLAARCQRQCTPGWQFFQRSHNLPQLAPDARVGQRRTDTNLLAGAPPELRSGDTDSADRSHSHYRGGAACGRTVC